MSSIINDKYKGKYKGPSDPVGELINAQCVGTGEDKKGLNIDDLFKMARNNNLNSEKLDDLHKQVGTKNAAGRLRMTIGNMLRSAAIRRGGLTGADGKWYENPKGFTDKEPVEDRQGNSTVVKEPKAAKEPKAEKPTEPKAPAKEKKSRKQKEAA